jgi:hypothetical protein
MLFLAPPCIPSAGFVAAAQTVGDRLALNKGA